MNAFARFAALFWSGIILFLWVCYAIVLVGHHAQWLPVFGRWLPLDYQMHFSVFALIAGIFITCFWFFRNRLISSSNSAFQATRNWSLGMVSVWSIILTLFVGWIDYSKGYEGVFVDLRHHLEGQFTQNDCMASENLGESEAPMLYYYTGILHQRQMEIEKPQQCRWLIVLSKEVQPAPEGMELFWSNHRPDEFRENLVVYRVIE